MSMSRVGWSMEDPGFLRVIFPVNPSAVFQDWPGLNYCHYGSMLPIGSSDMQLVFFSSDRLEVERVCLALAAAGIPCKVREGFPARNDFSNLPEAEVWIQRDRDLHHAFMMCVEKGIGFAKRETSSLEVDFW